MDEKKYINTDGEINFPVLLKELQASNTGAWQFTVNKLRTITIPWLHKRKIYWGRSEYVCVQSSGTAVDRRCDGYNQRASCNDVLSLQLMFRETHFLILSFL